MRSWDVGAIRSGALAAGSEYVAETTHNSPFVLSRMPLRACCSYHPAHAEIRTSASRMCRYKRGPGTGHLASRKEYGSNIILAHCVDRSASMWSKEIRRRKSRIFLELDHSPRTGLPPAISCRTRLSRIAIYLALLATASRTRSRVA